MFLKKSKVKKSFRERERERGELGAVETKVITPGKIVPYKSSLPSSNISLKKDFDTDVLLNCCSHTFLGTFCKFIEKMETNMMSHR